MNKAQCQVMPRETKLLNDKYNTEFQILNSNKC